jgi:N-acetylglucosamine-6-phosphate deacetylase
MIISNAKIVLENEIIHGFIEFDNKKIITIKKGKSTKSDYDAKGLFLLPAFIDSHTHGGYGLDFNMLASGQYQDKTTKYFSNINREGVGSILMTTVTCNDKDLKTIANNYKTIKAIDKNHVIKG